MLSRKHPFGVIIPFVEFVAEVMGWERWRLALDPREFGMLDAVLLGELMSVMQHNRHEIKKVLHALTDMH